MADNADEEHLDDPKNLQSENPSDEIIPSTDTFNLNQEKENMEVHAQELHKAPGHGWKHYLFEFFMLFLAVFCGFLAENQREKMVNHEREKHYIKSLEEDIQRDIRESSENNIELNKFMSRLDSITENLSQSYNSNPSVNCFHQISIGFGFSDFIYNDHTMQQLKNAGGMNSITNLQVADSIVSYDAIVRRGLLHQELINTLYLPRVIDKVDNLINIGEIYKLVNGNHEGLDTNSLKKAILLTSDKNELIRLINEIRHFRFMINLQLNFVKQYGVTAKRLLSLLQEEYKVE
jgi:hypothetical protein